MGKVIVKPLARIETAEGPLYATEVDGVVVHGDKPMTAEGKIEAQKIIEAARRHLEKMGE